MPEASIADLLAGSLVPPPPALPPHLQAYVDEGPAEQKPERLKLALASLAGPAPTPPPAPVPVVDVTPPIVNTPSTITVTPVGTFTPIGPVVATPAVTPEAPKRTRGRPATPNSLKLLEACATGGQTPEQAREYLAIAEGIEAK